MESLVVADIAELKDNQVRWMTAAGWFCNHEHFFYIRSQALNTALAPFQFIVCLEQNSRLSDLSRVILSYLKMSKIPPTGYLDPLHQWERRDYWWPHSHQDWPRLPLRCLQRWLCRQGFSSHQGKTGLVRLDREVVTPIDWECVFVCVFYL